MAAGALARPARSFKIFAETLLHSFYLESRARRESRRLQSMRLNLPFASKVTCLCGQSGGLPRSTKSVHSGGAPSIPARSMASFESAGSSERSAAFNSKRLSESGLSPMSLTGFGPSTFLRSEEHTSELQSH